MFPCRPFLLNPLDWTHCCWCCCTHGAPVHVCQPRGRCNAPVKMQGHSKPQAPVLHVGNTATCLLPHALAFAASHLRGKGFGKMIVTSEIQWGSHRMCSGPHGAKSCLAAPRV
ncbi:hypothetical protein FA10DRAFT_180852 [Acaromyces ingoldii]|uniref:Uncharacterized protein n=1 Tax=Acaromyces ingoldii TaxID=215250 RepID=A0A316YGF9_9BASI|nr:hypothetical protein FA10DRAFT_180852 [Acaromyces ingoldii]PWN87934.1 hypothetical protein FA10DRAFT_180852 [Acaromyces ingoldii]